MKKYFSTFTATAISTVLFMNADAQKLINSTISSDLKNSLAFVSADKMAAGKKSTSSDLNTINFRALKDFNKKYKAIDNEKWEKTEDGFIASFSTNAVWNRIAYTKKGRWLYSLQQYGETKLPKDIRALVKSNYYDYAITLVREINFIDNPVVYIVYLHNAPDGMYKNIRIRDGGMDEYESFTDK